MMVRNKIARIKAAVVSAAMVATTFAAPVISSFTTVTAATKEVTSLPYTFTADGVEDGLRQANIALPKGVKKGDTITLNFTTASTVDAAIGIYGYGTDSPEDGKAKGGYWYSAEEAVKSGGKSTFSAQVTIPSAMVGNPTKVGVGIWYPEDNSKWTLESISTDGSSSTDPGTSDPSIPVTANDKSGTCELVDNGDGTATITATLSAQYANPDVLDAEGNPSTQFDILLTKGTDEENYAPYKDADGNELPKWEEGMPINSHKFKFSDFGIDDMANITFQSFEYVISSDEYDMSTIQYGGGINVEVGSPADTEFAKGKDGYWYNDQGTEDLEEYAGKFAEAGIVEDVHSGYEATGCGSYAKLTWDVPKGVQPYVDLSNSVNAVGFQYWWGKDDTKTSESAEGAALNYAEIEKIHLKSCTATYTRTMTVPYNTTVPGPKNTTLTMGDDSTNQIKFPLADLELGERDKLSAIEFTFKSAEAMAQFVGACGISVDSAKVESAVGVVDGWYQTGNIAVINTDGTFKVMWMLPDVIRDGVYPEGEVLIGYWYGDVEGGETVPSVTVSDVQYHVYRTQEEDIEITDPDTGLTLPNEIELTVGETYDLVVNVDDCTFESDRTAVATVDKNGTITAVGDGLANITVTTPEGQTVKIVVTVNPAETTATTTVTTTTTTTTTVTTVDPDSIVDWSRVLYGDVNLDGSVTVADIVALSKHLVNAEIFPLENATAKENADTLWDQTINSSDNLKIIEYNTGSLTLLDLGPDDKSNCPKYDTIK